MKTPGARGNIHSLKVDSGLSHPLPHLLRHRSVHPVYVTNPQENTVSEQIHLTSQDDSLRYRVIAQRTLSQETVSVTISVTLLVSANQTNQASLQRLVRDALTHFIPKSEWVFSTLYRDANAVVGYEQVSITASARIPSSQNYNLRERARLASREGLTLSQSNVNYNLPVSQVNRVVHELRGEIVASVLREIEEFDRQTGRKWRIGEIEFGIGSRNDDRTAKSAQRSTGYEDMLDPDSEGLSGAERISLVAEVCLRAVDRPAGCLTP